MITAVDTNVLLDVFGADAKFGEAARSLYADAQQMLERIAAERWFRAEAVIGLWPANGEGDNILVFDDEARSEPIADASLPEMRARNNPGTAIAAMMPMIATTISSSISVKPFAFLFMCPHSFRRKTSPLRNLTVDLYRTVRPSL